MTALGFRAPYLQRVVISCKWHHQLPERRKHHQGRELQLVVGRHVLEEHGQAVHRQVFPLVLLGALHRHWPCHGKRHVHHHHRRHDELLLSATSAENGDPLHDSKKKGHKRLLNNSYGATRLALTLPGSPHTSPCPLQKGEATIKFYAQNWGFSTDYVRK